MPRTKSPLHVFRPDEAPLPSPWRVRLEVEAAEPANIALEPSSSTITITCAGVTVRVIHIADSPVRGEGGAVSNGNGHPTEWAI